MQLRRAISVLLLALGFALGSVVGVALATEQAFAKPCPMEHQSDDCPCCGDDCSPAMMGCNAKCSPSVGAAALPAIASVDFRTLAAPVGMDNGTYDPFVTGPPPPIPIV
jgi:hypothetical protein